MVDVIKNRSTKMEADGSQFLVRLLTLVISRDGIISLRNHMAI